jgi:TorA maturation chaperone TorD
VKDRAREDFCRFLAACHYEPGPEFAEERIFDSLREAAGRIDPGLGDSARRLGEAFERSGPAELLVEYARLYLGPPQALARPYASAWLGSDSASGQEAIRSLLALHSEGGFEVAEDFREPPDHIAAELEFLYLLIFRDNRTAGIARAGRAALLRRRFLDEHLGTWIGPYAAAVRDATNSAFYRELADLTERFVRLEASAPAI